MFFLFFSVLVRCFSAFVSLCFFVFVCFFSLLFSLFSTSCLHVRRSRSSSHLRKEKHDKTSGKNSGKKNSERRPKKKNEKKPTAYKCISGLPLFAFFAFIKIVVCFFPLCFCFFQKVVCFFCIGFRFFVFKFLRSRLQAFHNNSVSCCYWNKHCFPEASDFMGLL